MRIAKRAADILMTAALLFLMGYQFWGDVLHEWVGAGMFLLFLIHHLWNRSWYASVFRGKYSAVRIWMLVVNALLFVCMLAMMYSGIVMSRHVFRFSPVNAGMDLARKLHLLGSYWGMLLMSVHLGLHWNMVIAKIKKRCPGKAMILTGTMIAVYGGYVFWKRDFMTYLFLQSEFVFLDYSELPILFYLDYIALMGLGIFVGHYSCRVLTVLRKKKKAN